MEFHWNLGRHAYFKKYLARIFIFRFNAGKRMTLILKIQLRTIFILFLISHITWTQFIKWLRNKCLISLHLLISSLDLLDLKTLRAKKCYSFGPSTCSFIPLFISQVDLLKRVLSINKID